MKFVWTGLTCGWNVNARHNIKRIIAALIFSGLFFSYAAQSAEVEPDRPFSVEQAQDAHPVQLYHYAASLMASGEKNEAAFWFYAGQLRYRIHLAARPDLPPDGDPALFASLNSVIGQEINEYLGGDPQEWEAVLARVLEWDTQTKNTFTPRDEFPGAHAEVRAGLQEMLSWIQANHEEIRTQRAARGLENREQ